MGNLAKRLAAQKAAARHRNRQRMIVKLVIAFIGMVTIAMFVVDRVDHSPVDLFAEIKPLDKPGWLAGWTDECLTYPSIMRWTNLSDGELVAGFVSELATVPNLHYPYQQVDWLERITLPAPRTELVGERRAVIVGQEHAVRESDTNQATISEEAAICQRQIYQFLITDVQVQPDMTVLHEGVTPKSDPSTGYNSSLSPYIASVQFARRHPGVKQFPAEDDALVDLDNALGEYPDSGVSFKDWPVYRQIMTEMRSRVMARQMALVINKGQSPYLIVGDFHEAGIAAALNKAGYKVALWHTAILRPHHQR